MTDVFLVTAINYQSLFRAFELISHDCGRQAGHTNYAVPLAYQGDAFRFEMQLAKLYMDSDRDFQTLCIGEEEAKKQIVKEHNLEECDELLQRFFEEFQ